MELFTKAGDKNPTGIEHRDLKQRKGNQYQKNTAKNWRQRAEGHLVDLSNVSRTVASRGRQHSSGRRL